MPGEFEYVLARIDSRLLHGQVATAWTKTVQPTRIIVVSDAVAKDKLRKNLIQQAAPPGVKAHVVPVDHMIKLAKDNGLKGFEFFAFVQGPTRLANYKEGSFDRVVYDALNDTYKPSKKGSIKYYLQAIKSKLGYPVRLADYADYVNAALKRFKELPNVTPCINPMFDHSPRSNNRGIILHNDSPELWGKLCKESSAIVSANEDVDNLLFIKAWNEWGEGNYMEPDRKFGRAYIEEARKIFK